MFRFVPSALGWHRDLPDTRDYGPGHEPVEALLRPLPRLRRSRSPRGTPVTWGEFLPSAPDQGSSRGCTAHACVGLVEYFERRVHGRTLCASSGFLYRMARRLLGWPGDAGASFRVTLKALRRFGLPPRTLDPDGDGSTDVVPPAYLFSYACEYHPLSYLRLDLPGADGRTTLARVKDFLDAGLPVAFGFAVFDCITEAPDVPFPSQFDRMLGGQAVIALGYDDQRRIRSEKGALRVRNSWGPAWGEDGHGWLPYRYAIEHLAADFWVVLRPDWLEGGEFTNPL